MLVLPPRAARTFSYPRSPPNPLPILYIFMHDGDPGCTAENWNGCDRGSTTSCNSSNPASFNPTSLNVSQWVASMQAIGATYAVITAKHGCGHLLWPTKVQLPNGAPYTYHVRDDLNVLQQFVDALGAAGIGHGFYFSLTNNFYLNTFGHNTRPPATLLPGQANVTQAEYEDLSIALMTELWTQFGPLQEIWLDGGCGALCARVSALYRASPNAANAVAFNGGGGVSANAVRWCGTEGGSPPGWPTIWSTASCGWCPDGSGSGAPPNASGAAWYPSGVDVTLQQGDHWFYTPGDALHPLKDLATFFHRSVGANGHLEIDFAIDRTGNVAPDHAAAYAAFGAWIGACYKKAPLASATLAAGVDSAVLALPAGAAVDRVVMQEDQAGGQNVWSYTVEAQASAGGPWAPFSAGTTIGSKRIDVAPAPVGAAALRFTITAAFAPGHAGVRVDALSGDGCATE